MNQAHGNVMKRGTGTSQNSPEENAIKNASVNVTDMLTSSGSCSTASSCRSLLSLEEDVADLMVPSFDAQLAAVLSTQPTLSSNTASLNLSTNPAKRQRVEVSPFISVSLSSSSSSTVLPAIPKTRQPMGRPKKPVPENPPPKRPVGRPRIHPKKELDPNRQKRVAKGDKPLGRPRTRPPTPPDYVKRPRGRPRKMPLEVDGEPLTTESSTSLSPTLPASLYATVSASALSTASHPSTRSHDTSRDRPPSSVDSNAASKTSASHTPPSVPTLTAAPEASSARTPSVRHSARLTPPSTSAAALPVAPNSNSSSGASKSDVSVRSVLSKRRYA